MIGGSARVWVSYSLARARYVELDIMYPREVGLLCIWLINRLIAYMYLPMCACIRTYIFDFIPAAPLASGQMTNWLYSVLIPCFLSSSSTGSRSVNYVLRLLF